MSLKRMYAPIYETYGGDVMIFGEETESVIEAVRALDEANKDSSFSSMYVLGYRDVSSWTKAE